MPYNHPRRILLFVLALLLIVVFPDRVSGNHIWTDSRPELCSANIAQAIDEFVMAEFEQGGFPEHEWVSSVSYTRPIGILCHLTRPLEVLRVEWEAKLATLADPMVRERAQEEYERQIQLIHADPWHNDMTDVTVCVMLFPSKQRLCGTFHIHFNHLGTFTHVGGDGWTPITKGPERKGG